MFIAGGASAMTVSSRPSTEDVKEMGKGTERRKVDDEGDFDWMDVPSREILITAVSKWVFMVFNRKLISGVVRRNEQ